MEKTKIKISFEVLCEIKEKDKNNYEIIIPDISKAKNLTIKIL